MKKTTATKIKKPVPKTAPKPKSTDDLRKIYKDKYE